MPSHLNVPPRGIVPVIEDQITALWHADAGDLVARNVAALADTPKGQDGPPSKSLTLDQAAAVITAARTLPVTELRPGLKDVAGGGRTHARLHHAALSLLTGIRTEEARALRWVHVNLDGDPAARPPVPPHVAVWRSVRTHGETKTERSRRTLGLPQVAVQAALSGFASRSWLASMQADSLRSRHLPRSARCKMHGRRFSQLPGNRGRECRGRQSHLFDDSSSAARSFTIKAMN